MFFRHFLFVMDVELDVGLTKKVVTLTNVLEVALHYIYLTKYLVPNDKCKELGYMQVWHFIAKRNFLCHMSHMHILIVLNIFESLKITKSDRCERKKEIYISK